MEGLDVLTGRCLCGACSYEIEGEPVVVAHCHCLDCQRLSRAGHTTGAMFREADVRLKGDPSVYFTQSDAGNTVTRLFCGRCGSPLFGKNTGMPGFMTVMMGTLDAHEGLSLQVTIFTRTCRHWDVVDPVTQTFATQPAWKPDT